VKASVRTTIGPGTDEESTQTHDQGDPVSSDSISPEDLAACGMGALVH